MSFTFLELSDSHCLLYFPQGYIEYYMTHAYCTKATAMLYFTSKNQRYNLHSVFFRFHNIVVSIDTALNKHTMTSTQEEKAWNRI
jgi:hypothetical protein